MPVYVFLNLSAGLCIQPSIHPSVCLPICPIIPCITSFCPSVHPLVYPFFSLHVHLSLLLFIPLSNHLSVQLSMHTMHSIFLSIHPVCSSSGPSIYLSVCHLPFLPFISLPVHLSVQLPICPSIHPSIHLFVHLSIYQSVLSIIFPFFHACLVVSPSVCWAIPPAIYSICLSSNLPKPIHSIFLSIHPVRSSFGLSLYLFVCIYPSFHSSL